MNCCVKCFVDKDLKKHIRENGTKGDCELCKAENVQTIEVAELGDIFDQLLGLYEPLEAGKHYIPEDSEGDFGHDVTTSLAECIIEAGWSVFSDEVDVDDQNQFYDEIRCRNMRPKEAIFEANSSDLWTSTENSFHYSSGDDIWSDFAYHIRRVRRFLPKVNGTDLRSDPIGQLPELLQHAILEITTKDVFFRARIGGEKKDIGPITPFPAEKMSAPPAQLALRGRVNPTGIPYLYVAEHERTAISEVRAFISAKITVAKLKPTKNLKVVDLTKKHYIPSPFFHENLSELIDRKRLLNRLNIELARPINPNDSEIEYAPTQYLAEAILNLGYDGICYGSAADPKGKNYAFFSPENLNIDSTTKLITVNSIEVKYK